MKQIFFIATIGFFLASNTSAQVKYTKAELDSVQMKINEFAVIDLSYNISNIPEAERRILPDLFMAAGIADSIFWKQSYGDKNQFLSSLPNDTLRNFGLINYGPWERLNNNKPFIKNIGSKPLGARFYPSDMTEEEFNQFADSSKNSLYTVLRRDENNNLVAIPYHQYFDLYVTGIHDFLSNAARRMYRTDKDFATYLYERAQAVLSDSYAKSDQLWLKSQNNVLDIIIGPIETYEDQLKGIKTAYEAYIVVKDVQWSADLQKYVKLLPMLQAGLPVDKSYKKALPGLSSQIGAYDVLFYAGDCNSGSKTIAVNLPNDENVQMEYGTRRLQFKNVMRAKFDSILVPISEVLIDPSQRKYINFNAFFSNTMFHEVAHGLGIKNTITTNEPVTAALKQYYSALEEGKADVLGLYMITELLNKKELKVGTLEEYYTTFVASIFRSVRFGAASAHGKANMVRFNYFMEQGAIERNLDGTYKVNFEKMKKAVYSLSSIILKIQGDGDIKAAEKLLTEKGVISKQLQEDLDVLRAKRIPVDIVFKQGIELLSTK